MTQFLSPKKNEKLNKDIVLADESSLRVNYGEDSHARIYEQYTAEHGDVFSQLKLAQDFYWGNNVPRNYERVCTYLLIHA